MVQLEAVQQYYHGTGKRKTAIAQVRLYQDAGGPIIINGKPMDEYFGWSTWQGVVNDAFRVSNTTNRFRVVVKVLGGGVNAQAEAVRHGIARALGVLRRDAETRVAPCRLHHPRRQNQGKQEIRTEAGAPRTPVHEALTVIRLLVSPPRARGSVGARGSVAELYQDFTPHPNLPPSRGKGHSTTLNSYPD